MVIEGAAFTVRLSCLELWPNALVAVTVKAAVPNAVGVPPMTPLEAFKVSPAGNEPPVTAHVIGVLPEALRVCEYAVPDCAAGKGEVVVMDGAAFTARLSCLELLPHALVAVTVKAAAPNAVGVPPMTPLEAFKVSPAGNEPPVTAQVIGVLPEALSVCE